MGRCYLCPTAVPDIELLTHLRRFHPDAWPDIEPDEWPDGELVLIDDEPEMEDFL